jgi:hypothetical protein
MDQGDEVMLNEVTCSNILNSDIHKIWSADTIVRFQVENAYKVVPDELFIEAVKISFNLKEQPENIAHIIPAYKQRWPKPLTLKEMLVQLPKKFYLTRVK